MKKLLFLAFIAILTFSCSSKQTSTDAASGKTAIANKTINLDIEGMTCTGCENTIKEAVEKVPGVLTVSASHTEGLAVIKYDSTLTNMKTISDAITEVGYTVKGEKVAATAPPSSN